MNGDGTRFVYKNVDDILQKFGVRNLDEAQKKHLNKVWHRLEPWPDSVRGLTRLKSKFTICTLSAFITAPP